MNEDYILREKNAILNWFDIQEVEGRFSLNDKISDIMSTFHGKLWAAGMLRMLMKKQKQAGAQKGGENASSGQEGKKAQAAGFTITKEMVQMVGSFTVLRLTGMLSMIQVRLTKEELLEINRKLNKIRKPKR